MATRIRITELRHVLASSLRANPRNWRTHPQAQSDAMRGILSEIGYADSLIARELPDGSLMLIDGHLRAETTPGEIVPVQIVDLTEAEADKLLLSLDPLAAMAETDAAAMEQLCAEAETNNEALQAMWDEMQASSMGDPTEIVEDKAPEPPVVPITKPGDLWLLGDHRVMCGDSTKADDVERLMAGARAGGLLFDPPWDVEFMVPAPKLDSSLVFTDGRRMFDAIGLFGAPTWAFVWDCSSCWYTPNRPLQRAKFCLWYGEIGSFDFNGSHYGDAGEARTVFHSRGSYEFVPDARGKHLADIFQAPITKLHADSKHPHTKPLDWVRMLIADCVTGDLFDPFCGSGTSVVACEQLGRKCFGMEISPAYCDVIVKRWENLTGKKASLETTNGKTRTAKTTDNTAITKGLA